MLIGGQKGQESGHSPGNVRGVEINDGEVVLPVL